MTKNNYSDTQRFKPLTKFIISVRANQMLGRTIKIIAVVVHMDNLLIMFIQYYNTISLF